MKNFAIILLAFISLNVQAKPLTVEQAKLGLCKTLSETAETIMTKRQNGVDAYELVDAGEKLRSKNPSKELNKVTSLGRNFIIEAYSKPLFSTEEYKQKAIYEFKNDKFIECLQKDPEAFLH